MYNNIDALQVKLNISLSQFLHTNSGNTFNVKYQLSANDNHQGKYPVSETKPLP